MMTYIQDTTEFKNTCKSIWDVIKANKYITLCTHVDSDGDTIGSAAAFRRIIQDNLIDKEIKISGEEYPRYLSFLDKREIVSDEFFDKSLKIVIDTSTPARIWDKRVKPIDSLKLDHHHEEGGFKISIAGDLWPATAQLIYEFSEVLNLKVSQEAKDCLFVGLWTDTEGMTQRNISEHTQRIFRLLSKNKDSLIKKMQLNKTEKDHIQSLKNEMKFENNISYLITDDIVPNDYLRQTIGELSNSSKTEIFFGVTKVSDNKYRGELRSKGNVNVSIYAKKFGGGGHFSSSGFKVNSIQKAYECLNIIKQDIK